MRSAILSADLRDLPFGTRSILQGIHDLMREKRQPVLRTGEHTISRSGLAAMLGIALDEMEEHLPSLLVRRLLMVDAGGALYSPSLVALEERRQEAAIRRREAQDAAVVSGEPFSARTIASRANGMLGGRPPRSRNIDGQRQMPLMQAVPTVADRPLGSAAERHLGSVAEGDLGFLPETQSAFSAALASANVRSESKENLKVEVGDASGRETPAETQTTPDAKPRSETQVSDPTLETHPDADDQVDLAALTRELLALANIRRHPSNSDLSVVRNWVSNGHSVLGIGTVVRASVAAAKKPIQHLGYFQKAMDEARVTARRSTLVLQEVMSVPREDARLRPQQPGESNDIYLRRTKGLRPLVPPVREAGESDESFRTRLKRRFDIEVITAQSVGAPVPVWEEYAAGAQLAA